jgi:hypothetical protein
MCNLGAAFLKYRHKGITKTAVRASRGGIGMAIDALVRRDPTLFRRGDFVE